MKRREFLAASTAAAAGLVTAKAGLAQIDVPPSGRQYFELRTYHFASAEKQQQYEQFLEQTAVRAFNHAGAEPVGIFKVLAKDNPKLKLPGDPALLYVLLPHNSLHSVAALEDRLADDAAFQKAGHDVLHAPQSNAAYTRYESVLLQAMENAPRVTVSTHAPERIFELRTYESPNVERARNKLLMFNRGEFEIFKRAGMPGVFFGGAIIGDKLPQLTYMVVHENPADVQKQWSAFFSDPEWKKLSGDKSYAGNVSNVIDHFVRPAAGSQI